jgi:hypothetical protein
VNGEKPMTIWEGRQQNLFRKNGATRDKSIDDIKANLQDLKDEFEL